MVFASLIQLLFLFFWLRSRRCRRIRARKIRLLSSDHAFTTAASLRWTSTARTTAVVSACLLEGSCLNRQLRVRPRTSSFYQDTVQGWSKAEFKENFRVSRSTFAYLVSELRSTLESQDFLCSPIPVDQRLRSLCGEKRNQPGFIGECEFKTTSQTGLQSGFKFGILWSCERGNPHLTGFQCGLTAPCERGG